MSYILILMSFKTIYSINYAITNRHDTTILIARFEINSF